MPPSLLPAIRRTKILTRHPSHPLILAQRLSSKPSHPSTPPSQQLPSRHRTSHTTTPTRATTGNTSTMASDEDYMSFLNKANEDVSGSAGGDVTTQASKAQFKTVDTDAPVPKPIQDAVKSKDAFYVSDADEPFEGVSLKWTGSDGLPDEDEFAKMIQHPDPSKAEISIQDPLDWDSKGQYTKLLEAVREASKGNDVRVYRVAKDKTRAEYWLVSREEGRIVGAKALAVES